jgi:hypothetical protein
MQTRKCTNLMLFRRIRFGHEVVHKQHVSLAAVGRPLLPRGAMPSWIQRARPINPANVPLRAALEPFTPAPPSFAHWLRAPLGSAPSRLSECVPTRLYLFLLFRLHLHVLERRPSPFSTSRVRQISRCLSDMSTQFSTPESPLSFCRITVPPFVLMVELLTIFVPILCADRTVRPCAFRHRHLSHTMLSLLCTHFRMSRLTSMFMGAISMQTALH